MGPTERERGPCARSTTRTNFPPRCDLKIRRLSVRMRRDAAAKKVRFMDHPACLRRVRPCLYSTTCRRSPAFCSDGREGRREEDCQCHGTAGKSRQASYYRVCGWWRRPRHWRLIDRQAPSDEASRRQILIHTPLLLISFLLPLSLSQLSVSS